jgi:hypothetical protein
MKKYLVKLGWSCLALVLILGLVFGGFQIGTKTVKSPEIAKQVIGDTMQVPVFRIGNPVYGSTAVDYTIDGTDDNVQFQAAIDALPSTGGLIQVVSSGTISFSATVSRAINNVSIIGTGFGTYFTYNASDPIFNATGLTGWSFEDLRTDAGSITTAADTIFSNVQCGATKYVLAVDKVDYSGTSTLSGLVIDADKDMNGKDLTNLDAVESASLKASSLTSGRVPIAGTGGLLGDDADLTFSGATLTATNATVTTLLTAKTGRTATLVVAASNATALEKAQADYVCDGTADEVEINAAIAALPTDGGRICLTSGTFYIANPLVLNRTSCWLCGSGIYATNLRAGTNSINVIEITGWYNHVSDLRIYAGVTKTGGAGIYIASNAHTNIQNILMNGQYYGINCQSSILTTMSDISIRDCVATNGIAVLIGGAGSASQVLYNVLADHSTVPAAGLKLTETGDIIAIGCEFIHALDNLLIAPGNGEAVQHGEFTACKFDTADGNSIDFSPTGTGYVRGLVFTNCWSCSATNEGILMGTGTIDDINFIGQRVFFNGKEGIKLNGGINIKFNGFSVAGNSASSSGTYDGIYVAANVTKFSFVNGSSTQSDQANNTQKYGILVAAGTSDYYNISNNDLHTNVTGALSDGGTGTHKEIHDNVGALVSYTSQTSLSSAGTYALKLSGDTDDYFTFAIESNVPTIYGTGAYLRVGDAAATSHSLASEDDLMVSGKLEVDGGASFDSNLNCTAFLQLRNWAALTLSGGTVTVTCSVHTIAGEDASADALDTINGGVDGAILIISPSSDTVDITVTDVGNIVLTGAADFVMSKNTDTMMLIYSGPLTKWLEISRSNK